MITASVANVSDLRGSFCSPQFLKAVVLAASRINVRAFANSFSVGGYC